MGKVSELLIEMINRQIAGRGIVVWYDPEMEYKTLFQRLVMPGVSLLRLEEGYFRLRKQMEPYLEFVAEDGTLQVNADQPPSLLVYVPASRLENNFALIEVETMGVVLEPGAAHLECNTRLGLLAERVFDAIAPAKASHLARQADEGLLTLDELDRLAEESGSSATGALQVIFGQVSVEEIILQYLSSDSRDQAIGEKNALDELAGLIQEELGMEGAKADSPVNLRIAIRQYLLLSELLLQLPSNEIPSELRKMPLPAKPIQRDLVLRLGGFWRNRLDLKESYVEAAETVQAASHLTEIAFPIKLLRVVETFPLLERLWLDHAAATLIFGNCKDALEVAQTRTALFWSRERPAFQLEWKVIEAVASVCLESSRVKEELKQRRWTLDEMVQAYATYVDPWMRLDRMARHLETRYARLDTLDSGATGLDKIMVLARQSYADSLQAMALAYSIAAGAAEFNSRKFIRQPDVFKEAVRPALEQKLKTAYFLVDALRYEMAAELLEGLSTEYEFRVEPVLGQLPGITAVGMTALLPGAEAGLALGKKTGGLDVSVSGQTIASRQARMEWIQKHAGVSTTVYRLGELIKLTPKRKKEIASADLVVVTSQEIDRLGEGAIDEEETRIYIDQVLEKLRQAIRSLTRAGIQQILISADHGFQLIETVDPGLSMDPPGGDTVELHSRVWIGHGGRSADGYIRLTSSDLELSGPMEIAFPRGLGTFKVRGGTDAYFHGGISLQEHILPLVMIKIGTDRATLPSVLKIRLSMSKPKITNRLFTVTVDAAAEGLFQEVGRRVRLDVLSGKATCGAAVAAGYDFEEGTREITVKAGNPNVVTLMIQSTITPGTITVQVIDCESQLMLDELKEVPVELGI